MTGAPDPSEPARRDHPRRRQGGREQARHRETRRERARLLGGDRLAIFVPAVMSVGLVFWVVTEVAELARARAEEVRERRARATAAYVVDVTLARRPGTDLPARGFRPRPVYVMIGVSMLAGAVYVFAGSVANYARQDGYVGDIAWILVLASLTAIAALYGGLVALAVAARWPRPRPAAVGLVLRTPLGSDPLDPDARYRRPAWPVTMALAVAVIAALFLSLVVGWSPHVLARVDENLAEWLGRRDPLAALAVFDPVGETGVAIALAVLAGLAAFRCRVLAASFAMATAVGLLISVTLRPLVAQPRPGGGPLAGQIDSYPSGHVLLGVIIAGFLPLALAVIFDRRGLVTPLRVIFGLGVLASATHRVADGIHWPSDAVGGALVGLALVLAGQWAIDHQASHRACHHCPWSLDPEHHRLLGAVPVHPTAQRALRLLAHLAAAAAAAGLTVVTFAIDLPVDADGYTLGRGAQTGAQLTLAAVVSVGALLAWRWEAAGAILLALAATGVGIFAAVEYPPAVGVALTLVMMVPAVLLWLSWQHRRRPHEVVALAVATSILVGTSWVGASAVWDHYFGPTHPDSVVVDPGVDEVEWLWTGALHAEGVTVTARIETDETARLRVEAEDGPTVLTEPVRPDRYGIVRMVVDGLEPDTEHTFRVVVDDDVDRRRGRGRFRTPGQGAYSFRVTAGACARTNSNGAVFDAIRAEEPLLHLALGDMHYENLESTEPAAFLDAYGRALTTPAQGALARHVPTAYVWDDHDYGPNDADATSPGRRAARAAYRQAVPHYGVPAGDAPINQAFTVGRVRFVMTDTRSERRDDTMLGDEQRAWLVDELTGAAGDHAVVVWVNAVPWIGEPAPGSDTWAGYADERAAVADALAEAEVDNLVMVSGDAHMVAIDDGTNSGYSSRGAPGFPVLHAAALDRPGNVKGGPYSHGTAPGSGQYGVLEVEDDGGDEVLVRLIGRTWEGETLMTDEHRIEVG